MKSKAALIFAGDAVLELLTHATKAPKHVSPYGLTADPGPGLMLVKDDGITSCRMGNRDCQASILSTESSMRVGMKPYLSMLRQKSAWSVMTRSETLSEEMTSLNSFLQKALRS